MQEHSWFVVGISGAPCSGKQKLVHFLMSKLRGITMEVIHQYAFFHSQAKLRDMERDLELSYDKIIEEIIAVDKDAMYNKVTSVMKTFKLSESKRKLLFIVGHRIYDDPRLRKLIDMPIFLHLPDDIIKIRTANAFDNVRQFYFYICADGYIVPRYVQYRSRCEVGLMDLVFFDITEKTDRIIQFETKTMVIERAGVTPSLMDFRPEMDEEKLNREHTARLLQEEEERQELVSDFQPRPHSAEENFPQAARSPALQKLMDEENNLLENLQIRKENMLHPLYCQLQELKELLERIDFNRQRQHEIKREEQPPTKRKRTRKRTRK